MAQPQGGIIPEPGPNALFLILRVPDPHANGIAVGTVLARVPALTAAIAKLDARAKLVCTVSIGPEFWNVLSPVKRPAGLRQFRAIDAGGLHAPSTGGDVLVHLLSKRPDLNFKLARRVRDELGEAVEVMDEVHGFRYLDSRDLTGFIDGTENPKGKERAPAALIGREDPDFAGGSYVFTQRYVHNLAKWATVPVNEQERIIGRRKRDSKELSEKQKPATAHIARTVIEEHGEELEIVRHSFPYGNVNDAGLFFIAYCRTLDIPERMLRRMMGTAGDGLHDRLMEFSQAVTGAHFFAPSLNVLKALGHRPPS
jgi:putative iron-dependent peroxidase